MIGELPALSGRPEPEYTFAGFRLEADGTLLRGESVIHLPPKELAALEYLLENAGQVVSPQQLKLALWGDVHVGEDSLPKCLSSLRARLQPEECIQTVYKRGYRLTAEVRRRVTAPAKALPRLAIMPFATGYTVPEHLGPAIAEETIARLSNLRRPYLAVLARDSVFNLARRTATAQQLGETLKADLVLTGSLCALASHFRLRAEMIRIEDGTQIWVEDLLVDRNRVAGLESELVERLAFRLGDGRPNEETSAPERKKKGLSIAAAATPENHARRREAYESFLRGRHEWQTLQRHRMQDGLRHLRHAAELDPTLLAAKVDLVRLCVLQAMYGFMAPTVAAAQVRRTAASISDLRQAAAILPALGWISFHIDHDLTEAKRAFSLSAHLTHDTATTRARSIFALSRHRFDEAIGLLHEAIDQDPYSPWLQNRLAWAHHLAGQRNESLEVIRRSLALFPDHEGACLYGTVILSFNGEATHGTKLAQNLIRFSPYFDLATATHAYALACEGRKDEAASIMEKLQWLGRERFVIKAFNPAVYLALDDHESALTELRAAEKACCPWFFQMLADPRLKPLHGHPEFERMSAILPRMEAEAGGADALDA